MSPSIRVEAPEIKSLLEALGRTGTGEGSAYSGVIPSISDGPGLRYLIIKEVGEETEKGRKDGEIIGEVIGDNSTLAIVQGWLGEVAELVNMDGKVKRRAEDALKRRLELK